MNWDWIIEVLPLIKFFAIFAALVFAISRKWDLFLILGGAAIAMGLLFGMGILDLGKSILLAVIDWTTIRIVLLVWGIMTFSVALKETSHLRKFINSLEQIIPSYRISMSIVPAMVGLLPMPGGAIFSAPLLDELAEKTGLKPAQRTFTNHWFRHIWEYILPLYPGVITAAAIWDIPVRKLALFQAPLTVFAVAVGFGISLIAIKLNTVHRETGDGGKFREFIQGVWPFAAVVLGVLFLPIDLLIVVYAMILVVLLVNRLKLAQIWTIIKGGFRWQLLLMITAIMVFKRVMDDSGAAVDVAQTLIGFNLPLAVIFFTLPLIVGTASGITIAYVGITFPILIPMLDQVPGSPWGVMMLAYCGGFMGTMISPLHLCLILTNEYYGSSLMRSYRYLVPAVIGVSLLAIGYYFLLRLV